MITSIILFIFGLWLQHIIFEHIKTIERPSGYQHTCTGTTALHFCGIIVSIVSMVTGIVTLFV